MPNVAVMKQPSAEELQELSKLYNLKRFLEHRVRDFKEERYKIIQPQIDQMNVDCQNKYGADLDEIRSRIKSMKTKFRMDQEWSLYRQGIKGV